MQVFWNWLTADAPGRAALITVVGGGFAVRRELRLSTNELWYRSEVDENMRLLKETTDTIAIEIRANAEKAAINTPDVSGDAASS